MGPGIGIMIVLGMVLAAVVAIIIHERSESRKSH